MMGKKNKEKPEIIKTNKDVLPIRYYDEEVDAFVKNDSSFFNLFEVISKDRHNMQDDEMQYEILQIAKFYKLYNPDIKWIALNFPVNTSRQRKALAYKTEMTTDPVRKLWLNRFVNELLLQDKNITRREYYLMCFGKTKEEYIKNANKIINDLGQGRSKVIKEISLEKRNYILYKINNMNSQIIIEEDENENKEKE